MWIIDEALPTDRGTWLFKIDAHHDLKISGVFLACLNDVLGVFESGLGVVYRAGPYDDKQAVVLQSEDGFGPFARVFNEGGFQLPQAELMHE